MIPLADALAWLAARTRPLPAETVGLAQAAGRVLAEDVAGSPERRRIASIDGRAVRAADTEGASAYAPLPVGGAEVVAGAPMPPEADAVLPLHLVGDGPSALGPVPPGYGVAPDGENGLAAGTRLRPPHLAVLARLGVETVSVMRRPRVSVCVAGAKSGPDALTPMLAALIEAEHGTVGPTEPDLAIHAGRSGPGPDDNGICAFETVFAHGVLLRPGETAAIGMAGGVPAILLPGDPLACATGFALLAAPVLRRMAGRPEPSPIPATLARKIASGLGQIDAIRVRLEDGRAFPLGPAEFTTLSAGAGADGLVLVPEGSEGYPGGAMVLVHPLP
ncbi:MAG TPA: molybdopterin biosynthesis protein [Acetobacteraceae bacterium]|nr:molybdopterin biosynthesis protein [Acetobacteraceae bacterium]